MPLPGNINPASPSITDPSPSCDPPQKEDIPPLVHIAPSIFVLLDKDITAPQPDEPRDRIQRLETILASIEQHRLAVRQNLIWMFEREKRRLVAEARACEEAVPHEQFDMTVWPGVTAAEVDCVVHGMQARAVPGFVYNKSTPAEGEFSPPAATARDEANWRLLDLAWKAKSQLWNFEQHMMKVRGQYLERLDKERLLMEDVGKRPEERLAL